MFIEIIILFVICAINYQIGYYFGAQDYINKETAKLSQQDTTNDSQK